MSETGLRSWLTTTDHKRIGLLYLYTILVFFAIASVAIAIVRIELLTPEGDVVTADTYNRLFTIHGVVMVWFFLIPSIPNVFGNYLLPLMIGARDLAFPRLNLASWYLFVAGGTIALAAIILGGVDTGWTFYPPYSSEYSNSHVVLVVIGVFTAGVSSIMTGVNFIVTTHQLRTRGMTWLRLPMFVWSNYATALILVLATPVLGMTLLLLAIERLFGIGLFDYRLGGDPLLFQHFFWFYSHPAVYIMILPGMGVVSEIIPCFSRNRLFGYRFVAGASLAIASLGFLVWGHHMFVSGQSSFASLLFSALSFMVAVPSAVKVFSWMATLHRGRVSLQTPMLYALGFIGLFTLGGLTGLFLASLAADVHLHDTYFVVAHFHYIMVGGMVLAFLGAVHFWWPKITGRMYSERWSQIAAISIFVGFNLTFFPQFVLGVRGMPRRYHSYAEEFTSLHVLSTSGTILLAIGYVAPLIYLLASLRRRPDAGANPWGAVGLEWQTSSPPPSDNFVSEPVVTEPYDYSVLEDYEGA
jgi:cytochrome c oxidase subunit 1